MGIGHTNASLVYEVAAQQVTAADVAIEAPVDAGFRLQSFWWL
jgi:hypothetical protein